MTFNSQKHGLFYFLAVDSIFYLWSDKIRYPKSPMKTTSTLICQQNEKYFELDFIKCSDFSSRNVGKLVHV